MTDASVGIYLTGSKKPYYETETDANGYFSISSPHLPSMNYSMLYSSRTVARTVSPSVVLAENVDIIEKNTINPNKYSKQISPMKTFESVRGKFSEEKDTSSNLTLGKNSSSNIIFVVIVLCFIGLIVGAMSIRIYLHRKEKQ
ncbi:hypothetical protein HY041_02495 [Candidatus Roizmanbacteria bacterium]|nr:hypothetical protein [Candidatus Roizmanbacteria bacterium]